MQTRSQVRSNGVKTSRSSRHEKEFRSKHKTRKTTHQSHKSSVVKLHIGQGRAGLKRKRSDPINQAINPPSELSQKIPAKTKIETGKTNLVHSKDPMHIINNSNTGMTHTSPLIPDVPFHPGLTYRPPPKPNRLDMPRSQQNSQSSSSIENINPEINLDFEENSPFQEGIISEIIQSLDKSLFQKPKELNDLINTDNWIQTFLPKQADIDGIGRETWSQVQAPTTNPVTTNPSATKPATSSPTKHQPQSYKIPRPQKKHP